MRDNSSIKDGDFSVILHNVTMGDEGTYKCEICTKNPGGSRGQYQHSINLTVSGADEEQPEEKEDEGTTIKLVIGITVGLLSIVFVAGVIFCCVKKCKVSFRPCYTRGTVA